MHRSLLEETGLFDESLPACEDYDLWLRICSRYPVLYIDEALITKHGGHDDQLSAKHWGMDRFRIHALNKIVSEGKLNDSDRDAAINMMVKKISIYLAGAYTHGHTEHVDKLQAVIDEICRGHGCGLMSVTLKNNALEQIANFYQLDENTGTSGQPEAGQFSDISAAAYEIVLNLALSDSPNAIENESTIISKLNMSYVHVPVDFKTPTLGDLESFFDQMEKHKNKKIFVHCVMNWRVSAFMFLYHTIKCDMPVTDALQHMNAVWEPESVWQEFIDNALDSYGIDHD